jgi:hypothetical protein
MSNDDPTCEFPNRQCYGSNQNNVIVTSRKLRREIRNDNSDNDTEGNIPEYRLISLAAYAVSNIQHMCGEGKNLPFVFYILSFKTGLI